MITNISVNQNFSRPMVSKPMPRNDVAFGKISTGKILMGSSLGGYGLILALKCALIGGYLTGTNEKKFSDKIGWGYNTQILSSVGQNCYGAAGAKTSYANTLVDLLKNNKIKTPEAANDSLAKSGYKIKIDDESSLIDIISMNALARKVVELKTLHPLETPGQRLNIFNKDDSGKKRYVLIVSDGSEERFAQNSKLFEAKIKDTYKIPSSNIINISAGKDSDFAKGVDSISKKITDIENSELLVLYSGHGGASALFEGAEKAEGDMEGLIINELTESKVKDIFAKKLEGIKTLFVVDACQSGAWIANKAKSATKLSRLA